MEKVYKDMKKREEYVKRMEGLHSANIDNIIGLIQEYTDPSVRIEYIKFDFNPVTELYEFIMISDFGGIPMYIIRGDVEIAKLNCLTRLRDKHIGGRSNITLIDDILGEINEYIEMFTIRNKRRPKTPRAYSEFRVGGGEAPTIAPQAAQGEQNVAATDWGLNVDLAPPGILWYNNTAAEVEAATQNQVRVVRNEDIVYTGNGVFTTRSFIGGAVFSGNQENGNLEA